MKLSIRGKILSLLSLLALVAVGVATWLHINSSVTARREEVQQRAQDVGEFVGLLFKNQLLKDVRTPHEKRKLVQSWLQNKPEIRFLSVFNSTGKRIFTQRTSGESPPKSSRLNRQFILKTLNSDADHVARELPDEAIYDFLVPVELFEINFGLVRVGFDASRFYASRNSIIQQNAIFGLLVLIGVTVLGYFFTNVLVKPLKHLERIARRFGGGDLSARSSVTSGDEIENLSNQFNTMANRIEQQIEDLRTIEELNRKISARLRPEKLYDRIIQLIQNTWDINYIGLVLGNGNSRDFRIAAGLNVSTSTPEDSSKLGTALNKLADETEQLSDSIDTSDQNIPTIVKELFNHESRNLSDVLVFRLDDDATDEKFGFLILARDTDKFEQPQINLLQTLTHQIKIAVQNARNYQRAVTDDLTGLYTRRFFEMELEKELDSVRTSSTNLSLAMIDIDNFKDYNDTYGHPAGDRVLERLAGVFREEIRSSDILEASRRTDTVARYGGEEFVIILPSTGRTGAKEVGKRIVDNVADIDAFEQQVTVSIGVAEYREGDSKQDLLKRADDALYAAKERGKNQVADDREITSDSPEEIPDGESESPTN